ncbi:asparagine-rich protein-like [Mytilus californianus]|uniref:asparagine-rich protein-like n=1 Tax=Mytilus californianus TaxID=6549 RepID=UPI0022475412|nr:asparagine-rich protein-like [Mytilus californianus]
MSVENETNKQSNHQDILDSIGCENGKDGELTNVGTYKKSKSTNKEKKTKSEKPDLSINEEKIFFDGIRCSSGKVHELSCVGTVDHSGSKEEETNKKDRMDNSDNKGEKRRKTVAKSKNECRQLTKNILQTSETTKDQPEKLQNVSNDTELMLAEKKKKETKKHKKGKKEVIHSDQNVKFAEILRKRLEYELARQKHNQTISRNDKDSVDIDTTVAKDNKECMKVKDQLVIEEKNYLSKHKTNEDVKTGKVKTTYTLKTDHNNERNTNKENESKLMPKSSNEIHVKDGITHRSENEKQPKNKAQNTCEDIPVKDIYKQSRKPTHTQSNKCFIIRHDSDHDENEGKPRKSSQYNWFPVNEMKNGKFHRANSTKTSHSTPHKRHLYKTDSNISVFSSSIKVNEESPANLYSSYQNILCHTHNKDELHWRMGQKYRFSDVHDRDENNEKLKSNEPKVNDNNLKTRRRHNTSKGNETKTNTNISHTTEANSISRVSKPRCNAWTVEAPYEQVADGDTRNNKYREKITRAARRPQNRCLYSEDDDKDVVLRMVQIEIQKQYERINEVRIKNELNQKDRQQELNASFNRDLTKAQKKSKEPFCNPIKNSNAYNDDKGVNLVSKENDELQRLKVNTAKKDKTEKKEKFINKTLNKVYSEKTKDSAEDWNNENKDVSSPMVKKFNKKPENLRGKNDLLQSVVDIHDIGVNVSPPHHSQQKVDKYFRVPSKKDRNKVVRVGGGWSNINDYYKRHVPVKRREYNRSSNHKGRSYLSFQSHYKCPPKLKHHSKVKDFASKKVTLN